MARAIVRGVRETATALRSLSRAITPSIIQEAHRVALEPMQDDARRQFMLNGSMKTGVIPNDLQIVPIARNETSLGMTGMGAKLGHLIELGTMPHDQPNRGIRHPGASPKPFLRPAFEARRDDALRLAGDRYMNAIERLARAVRR